MQLTALFDALSRGGWMLRRRPGDRIEVIGSRQTLPRELRDGLCQHKQVFLKTLPASPPGQLRQRGQQRGEGQGNEGRDPFPPWQAWPDQHLRDMDRQLIHDALATIHGAAPKGYDDGKAPDAAAWRAARGAIAAARRRRDWDTFQRAVEHWVCQGIRMFEMHQANLPRRRRQAILAFPLSGDQEHSSLWAVLWMMRAQELGHRAKKHRKTSHDNSPKPRPRGRLWLCRPATEAKRSE